MRVQIMTGNGPFRTLREQKVSSTAEALAVVTAEHASSGYTGFSIIDDGEDEPRITAKTKGGRGGRNLGYIRYDEEDM